MNRLISIFFYLVIYIYPVFAMSENRIESDDDYMASFLSAMDALRTDKDTVINIVHIGDSHIQAGFLSGEIRRSLQAAFGNAGRGLITPLRIAKTNEPTDYFFVSPHKSWTTGKLIQNSHKTSIGPGGIGISCDNDSVDFSLGVTPRNGAAYKFSRIIFYRDTVSEIQRVGNGYPWTTSAYDSVAGLIMDTVNIPFPADTVSFSLIRRSMCSDSVTFYGANLLNDSCGIVYHSMGINGAEYKDFAYESFTNKLSVLQPSLIIVSLGTNESFNKNYSDTKFASDIDTFINLIKKGYPDTKIILTTPAECYTRVRQNGQRVFVRNVRTENVSKVIVQKAKQHNVAYWNLFELYGGVNSCKRWLNEGLLSKDRIHFTAKGYAMQATLFVEAFMRQFKTINEISEIQK